MKTVDPSLPLPVFWALSAQAVAETPTELRMVPGVVDTAQREQQRLDWQTKRAIVPARQALQPPTAVETRSAPNTAAAPATASVTPARAGAPAPALAPTTMVEQIRARQPK